MDYLRRLYPGAADLPGAARLDVAPACGGRVATTGEPATAMAPQSVGDRLVDASEPSTAPPRRPQASAPAARPTIDALAAPPPVPAMATPPVADQVAPHPVRTAAEAASPKPGQARQALAPLAPVVEALAAPPAVAAPRSVPEPAGPSRFEAPLQAPLRITTVLQADAAERDRQTEPAPIVHVTIDRIDVRLPSAPAAAAPPARRRPPSAVGGLGDYLRGRPAESR